MNYKLRSSGVPAIVFMDYVEFSRLCFSGRLEQPTHGCAGEQMFSLVVHDIESSLLVQCILKAFRVGARP